MDVLKTTGILIGILASACVPDVDVDESLLGAPRLLAVRAEPSEAAPGDTVRFVGLYADASGAIDEAPLDWAFCIARKPLAELGPVARACLEVENDALVPIGVGLDVSGAIPRDACRLFGPEPPPSEGGEPAGRPVDPDVTGGYAQPLRVLDPSEGVTSLVETRLACGLFGATQQQSVEYTQRYRRNASPTVEALEITRDDGTTETLGDEAIAVRAGEVLTVRVRWPECALEDTCGDALCGIDETRASCAADCTTIGAGCGGAERYLRFDLATRTLVPERESIRVAWYVSGGTLESERTGVADDDTTSASENVLTAPDEPGELTLVVVLRDARGGAAWSQARLRVEP
ncbi:hypothetical protein [Sandaracinus amylolyticus]|uniref:hypothetical protein n=1 Tax=Sandaracinus amylolyticus TaxID=927083 RepID=UPI001F26556C|nr:hypothetical protein [Sandaracinus amylolyticus]UJR81756.1 Hypothetical protein I5071_38160 [Sandaracinus amylolyticus]